MTFCRYFFSNSLWLDILPLCSMASYYTFLTQVLLRSLAIVITAAAANVYMLIPALLFFVIFLLGRWYYLKTSRDIKRLEAICEYTTVQLYLATKPPLKCNLLPLQLAVHCTLTSQPLFRDCLPLDLLGSKMLLWICSTSTTINIPRCIRDSQIKINISA